MSVFLIRHGQSEFNVGSPHKIDPLIFDAPLTDLGKTQADQARRELTDVDIQQVICSPLTRAVETTLRIFGDRVPITIDATHREWLTCSCDVGRAPQDLSRDFPMLDFSHLDNHWWHKGAVNENDIPIEPEESFLDRIKSFDSVLDGYKERPIAVVGHGYFLHGMTGHVFDNCEIYAYQ